MKLLQILVVLVMLSPPSQSAPFIVAHRGASGEAPENTMPAFELAWKLGADAIEGDFHLTGDGHIVCFHDFDTKKITGRKLVLKTSTLAELRTLDVGAWKAARFADTRIPTFADVAASVPDGKKFYVEVKSGPEIVPPLLAEIKKSELRDSQIVVISFHEPVIAEIKKLRPQWVANWLYSFDHKVADAPARDMPKVLRTLQSIKADGLGSNAHQGLDQELLAQLQGAGFDHHVWTVNDEETARRFLDLGTRSITTDLPGKLREALAR